MTIDARLNKLMPVLTARERAILVLESWKEGENEDPQVALHDASRAGAKVQSTDRVDER